MTWEFYEHEDDDGRVIETTYYHDEEEIVTLGGRHGVWKNGIPHPKGEHYNRILDEILGCGTPLRNRMLFNVVLGFSRLDNPIEE